MTQPSTKRRRKNLHPDLVHDRILVVVDAVAPDAAILALALAHVADVVADHPAAAMAGGRDRGPGLAGW